MYPYLFCKELEIQLNIITEYLRTDLLFNVNHERIDNPPSHFELFIVKPIFKKSIEETVFAFRIVHAISLIVYTRVTQIRPSFFNF